MKSILYVYKYIHICIESRYICLDKGRYVAFEEFLKYHTDFVIILMILQYHYKGRKLIRSCCVNSILHPIIHYCRILLIVYKEHSVDTMETCKDNLHHHDPKNHKMYMKISPYHVS